MKRTILIIVALLAVLIVGILVFAIRPQKDNQSDKLTIVTTLFPLYDWTRTIAGDAGDVTLLLTGGAGAHDVSLTPQAAVQLQQADVLIMNGAGLETFIETAQLKTDNPHVVIIQTSDAVKNDLLAVDEDELEEHPEGVNPHIWLSPKLAGQQAQLIMDTLIEADPAHAATYRTNGATLLAQLKQLDTDFTTSTRDFTRRSFIAFHDAMPYVARDYNLNQVAVVEEFPGEAPSPQDIADLHTLITEHNVRVIFTEPQFSPRVAETLASDTGAVLAVFDTLETADPKIDTYISKMRENLSEMQRVLE